MTTLIASPNPAVQGTNVSIVGDGYVPNNNYIPTMTYPSGSIGFTGYITSDNQGHLSFAVGVEGPGNYIIQVFQLLPHGNVKVKAAGSVTLVVIT